jgi:hypothetical protein
LAPAEVNRLSGALARRPPLPWLAVAIGTSMAALLGTVGADSRWLEALGRAIIDGRSIPDGVPFATAPTSGWPNVPVLAELLFRGLGAIPGDRGLLVAQALAVGAGMAIVLLDQRRAGAGERAAFFALLLTVPASFGSIVAVRAQLFSLVLFPVLALLIRREAAAPSRRIWLLVPLIAVWSNLHGAVLTGLAVAGAYLLLERMRHEPLLGLGVLLASIAALCLTPALLQTPGYYAGVLRNEAARQGVGLWAPLSPTSVLDVIFASCAFVLVLAALRSRPRPWEILALAGLAALSVKASRGGVFLVLFAAVPAAVGLEGPARSRPRLAAPLIVAFAALALLGIVKGPILTGATDRVVNATLAAAGGTPVLAQDQLAEQVALAGGRIWAGNPIDAFDQTDQRLYVDWMQGEPGGDPALAYAPRAVLVRRGSEAEKRMATRPSWRRAMEDARTALYVRRH